MKANDRDAIRMIMKARNSGNNGSNNNINKDSGNINVDHSSHYNKNNEISIDNLSKGDNTISKSTYNGNSDKTRISKENICKDVSFGDKKDKTEVIFHIRIM